MNARRCALLTALIVSPPLVACGKDQGTSGGASSATAAPIVSSATSASAAPKASAAGRAVVAPVGTSCEVEVFGNVKGMPAGKPVSLILSDQDCLADDARVVGRSGVSVEGKFFYEVFVKWGTDLTICAAQEPSPGKPATLYGKAKGPFHAEATGEVMFKDIVIELTKGPPHAFPTKLEQPAGHK